MATTTVQRVLVAAADEVARRGVTLPAALAGACVEALPVSSAALTIQDGSATDRVVAATPGSARVMEELQFELGEGPCLQASALGRPVLHPDLRHTGARRWPAFTAAALHAGIASVFALPLQVGAIRLGMLALYADSQVHLSPDELHDALVHAEAATAIMLHLQDQMPLVDEVHPDLGGPTPHRAAIHQATGMISVQAAVGLTEALLLLRGYAWSNQRSVQAVARDVVARTLRFPREKFSS